MKYIVLLCASLLLALFLVTKLLGGKSLNRIKVRTVGHVVNEREKYPMKVQDLRF